MRAPTFDLGERQADLFGGSAPAIAGLRWCAQFISAAEEAALLDAIGRTVLQEAQYKEYTARRRIASYGTSYDFDLNRLRQAPALPDWLHPLRQRAAEWLGVEPTAFVNGLIAEYRAGTPLGWHRDVPDFEQIVGVSLGATARMRLRRYPPSPLTNRDTLTLELPPRSAYILEGEARWKWQHSISPTEALRHSITLRTPALPRGAGRPG